MLLGPPEAGSPSSALPKLWMSLPKIPFSYLEPELQGLCWSSLCPHHTEAHFWVSGYLKSCKKVINLQLVWWYFEFWVSPLICLLLSTLSRVLT
jgi:hypothetical protein